MRLNQWGSPILFSINHAVLKILLYSHPECYSFKTGLKSKYSKNLDDGFCKLVNSNKFCRKVLILQCLFHIYMIN